MRTSFHCDSEMLKWVLLRMLKLVLHLLRRDKEAKLAASNVEDCGQFSRAKEGIVKKDGCNFSLRTAFFALSARKPAASGGAEWAAANSTEYFTSAAATPVFLPSIFPIGNK